MQKVSKNKFTVLTFLILISFTASSISLSELLKENCKADKSSCCCKDHSEKPVKSEIIQKQCCCEISQNTNQPAAINYNIVLENQKIQNNKVNVNYCFNYTDNYSNSANYGIVSFHSLPFKDICIYNSILRI